MAPISRWIAEGGAAVSVVWAFDPDFDTFALSPCRRAKSRHL